MVEDPAATARARMDDLNRHLINQIATNSVPENKGKATKSKTKA